VRFKIWLRGPADAPRIELIGDEEWYRHSGPFSRHEGRSVMAELLAPQDAKDLQFAPGQWLLPGTPP
jgi:hypothetical protein